jgi:hypothetical protein
MSFRATPDTALNPPRKPSLHTDYPIPQSLRYTQTTPHPWQSQIDEDRHLSRPDPRWSPREGLLTRCLSPMKLLSDVLRNEVGRLTENCIQFQVYLLIIACVYSHGHNCADSRLYRINSRGVRLYSNRGIWVVHDQLFVHFPWFMTVCRRLSILTGILLSVTTLCSFRRVVRRHDRDAFLQQPAAWDRVQRAERAIADLYHGDRSQRTRSPILDNRPLRRSCSSSSPRVSQHLFAGYTLNPVRSRDCCSFCTPSVHTDNMGLCWNPSCGSIDRSFLDTQSSGDPPSSCSESMPQDEHGGSDTLHTLVKGEG